MDIDGDGNIDILSGSYSRMEGAMAGLFQVLRGKEDGTFHPAEPLLGNDDRPLIVSAESDDESEAMVEVICTRPTAVDLDGDGTLDIVTGNFRGTFAIFQGEDGGGFDPVSSPLLNVKGEPLDVGHHSDPTFADWDGDGDLDMISGTGHGGAWLFPNVGSKTEPAFGEKVRLLKDPEHVPGSKTRFGEAHIRGAQQATRVTPADVDGDGKLDLLVGDNVTVMTPVDGMSEEDCAAKLGEWETQLNELFQSGPKIESAEDFENMTPEQEKAFEEHQELVNAHFSKKAEIVNERHTGFVWLYKRK